jgi:hypothetical protein
MYLAYLRSQNIEARVDADGDIAFRYELPRYGQQVFYIIVYEDDQQFFQILMINILSSNLEDAERDQAYIATIYATLVADTVKMFLNEDGTNIWVSGEVFIAAPEDFRFVFPKMMPGFGTAIDVFLDYMR